MPDMIRPAVTHATETLSLGDFLAAMKRSRRLRPMLLDAFVENYLVNRARRAGLSVNDQELQQAADNFRLKNGMASTDQTTQWFQREAITSDDFAAGLERDLLVEKLRRAIADPRLQEVFNQNTARFARVRLKRLLVATEAEARQAIDAIANNSSTFEDQVRQRSLDLVTKNVGGEAGIVRRVDLAQPLGDAIFATEAGNLVGPVQAGQGFLVFRVEEFLPAELDEGIRNGLRKEIFDAWLRQELSRSPIQFPLLEALNAGQRPA
ncbi:MAG TPA: peptidyl-prolyl cis-trans isomerase [Gemmataceae bacterium]|jgi:parvulin-like peptidyl-prolyl isomerase|nr:peptidyl-prolyl cis-trans isomerase [Gemmataceae bacterium]